MKLNSNTRKANNFIQRYSASIDEYLTDVYNNPSEQKVEAYKSCYRKMLKMHGSFLRIISYSTFTFTVAWVYPEGQKVMLNVETAYNSYQMEFSE